MSRPATASHPPGDAPARRPGEQLRGDNLRRHILSSAKEVFLDSGFERTSMDAVAARAGTSKRSLYAHFPSKDVLFVEVMGLVRELYLDNIRTPDAYGTDPVEAVTRYCGRFQQLMLWDRQIRTCRLGIAEAERLPESAAASYDGLIAGTTDRLAAWLADHYGLDDATAAGLAASLLGQTVLPRLLRALFGVEPGVVVSGPPPDEADMARTVDLDDLRRVVLATLPRSPSGAPDRPGDAAPATEPTP
jgi:AcrR family transcriptional regulator